MRTFWIVVVVVVLAGGAWVFMPSGRASGGSSEGALTATGAEAADATTRASGAAPTPASASAPAEPAAGSGDGAVAVLPDAADSALVEPVIEASASDSASAATSDSDGLAGGLGSLVLEPGAMSSTDAVELPAATAPEGVAVASSETDDGDVAELKAEDLDEAAATLAALIDSFGSVLGGGTERAASAMPSGEVASNGDEDDVVADPATTATAPVEAIESPDVIASASEASGTAEPDAAEALAALDAVAEHPEGGLEIGGRWRVPGTGTADDPYVVRWDILQSAMQIYNPRIGKTEPPAWSEAFNGKRVAIEGYVVLPLAQQSSKEILLTLNQWDGCCIGVPPTPYDAIEVTLTEPIDGQAAIGAFYYGRLEGTFSVDPYLAGGWLLGLYLMDDAVLTSFGAK